MGAKEYGLLALVVGVPLIVAVVVTLWSLEQVRYRPKRKATVRTAVGQHGSGSETAPGDPATAGGSAVPSVHEPDPGAAAFGADAGPRQRPPEPNAGNDRDVRAAG